MRSRLATVFIATAALVVSATSLQASNAPQEAPASAAAARSSAPVAAARVVPPSRRVGRISLISGKAEYRGPGDAQASAAAVNDPVADGVTLRTAPQSRAEIRIGADTISLAEDTAIRVVRLDPPNPEIAVNRGRINLEMRSLQPGQTAQVDIPGGGVWLLRSGRYDVDTGSGDKGEKTARIAAFTGAARFAGAADISITAGDRVVLGTDKPSGPQTEIATADEFAKWAETRAVDDARLAAPYFVSRDMTGYGELDKAGNWRSSDKYGEIWVPNAAGAGWVPYRNGHWRWLSPWGWSWVDDAPWGFATSHYGRWRFADGVWSWVPGRFAPHPVWAPAVVTFLGTPGVGLSYAEGRGPAIAWLPLAPDEIYWPSYTGDLDYIRAINYGAVADVRLITASDDDEPPAEVENAELDNREFASVVPRAAFVGGQEVASALISIPDRRLENAPAIVGSPRIGPPPAPADSGRAAASRERQPDLPPVRASTAKRTGRNPLAGETHSRKVPRTARTRVIRVRASTDPGSSRLRHSIVLRVARPDHAGSQAEARTGVTRR